MNLDILALRAWRASCPELQEEWPEDKPSHMWDGVTWAHGRVTKIKVGWTPVGWGLSAVPACIGQLTSLTVLNLNFNCITSLPPAIGKLRNLKQLGLFKQGHIYVLESLPAEIGQLTSLTFLNLVGNHLTSLPAEIGQLTSLQELYLAGNQLTSLAEIRPLTQLQKLSLGHNRLTTVPEWIEELTSLDVVG